MSSAIKPTLESLRTGDAAKAIKTMLQEGYNPTAGGVEAMKAKISELGDQVSQAIANSPATINKNAVGSRLLELLDKVKKQVNPNADMAAVEKSLNEFLSHPALSGKTDMTAALAQELKQGTYRQLGNKPYGEMKGAETEAQKALARGLKEEISAAVPEVAPLNARESSLITAKDVAERRALMEANKNPLPLGASIGAVAHDPMSTLGLYANSSAFIKSMLARALYSGAERIPGTSGQLVGAGYGAQSGQSPDTQALLARILRNQQ